MAIRWVFPSLDGPLLALGPQRAVVGRDAGCAFQLAGTETSRRHAELWRDGPIAIVRDLGSTNGVRINGVRRAEAPLSVGDVLRIGEWVGIVVQGRFDSGPAFVTLAERLYAGPRTREALEPARRAAQSGLPVIIEGETGTGKERAARAIHAWSGRTGAFVAVNCAALPESLAESELFGHRRGAFTGADRSQPGHFRSAHGGTLLFDEIADLPAVIQAKLLRVLEEREVLPLGESRPVPVDVRILVASQEPLIDRVTSRRFRPDLFARLEGVTVRLPPLRERIDEVAYLFARFLREHTGGVPPAVEAPLVEALCMYDWPFNVRELDLTVRRLLTLHAHAGALRKAHLPERMRARTGAEPENAPARPQPQGAVDHARRREGELARLIDALRQTRGNVARAAALAGVSRQRAYRLLEGSETADLSAMRGAEHLAGNDSRKGPDHR